MARKLRVQYQGAIYHVMSRGNGKAAIFRNDVDRRSFLQTLAEACAKTGWQVHAYCLMKTHFHLVLETPRPNLVRTEPLFGSLLRMAAAQRSFSMRPRPTTSTMMRSAFAGREWMMESSFSQTVSKPPMCGTGARSSGLTCLTAPRQPQRALLSICSLRRRLCGI